MIKNFGLILFLPFLCSTNAQMEATIIDSITGESVSQVNIWLTDKGQGTFSDEKGFFSFKKTFGAEKVIFSAVGYKTKEVPINQIHEKILLSPQTTVLNEAVVQARKSKRRLTKRVNRINRLRIKSILPGFENPQILAKYFPYKKEYRKTRFLKEIRLFTQSSYEHASFNIRLFSVGKDSFPDGYIYSKNIRVLTRKGKKITRIDLNDENIVFPEDGFFLGVEWVRVKENLSIWNSFEPYIGFEIHDNNEGSWFYRRGVWKPMWELSNEGVPRGEYRHLAAELILSE
ncbi:carboxypeptidase-like regulatory domain-containing protein [Maribacter sp. 2210JD10-5]|uniref:carboxypeptidase-like regulatory domain-containing protein n=1 Tax=Maribacter sp. 2210JD10-5 TaxID=3386272 RepID=UPI0039BC4BA6